MRAEGIPSGGCGWVSPDHRHQRGEAAATGARNATSCVQADRQAGRLFRMLSTVFLQPSYLLTLVLFADVQLLAYMLHVHWQEALKLRQQISLEMSAKVHLEAVDLPLIVYKYSSNGALIVWWKG